MRTLVTHKPPDFAGFKHRLLEWSQQFREVVFLDSNDYPQTHTTFDFVLAADALTSLKTGEQGAFEELHAYQKHARDWIFGYLTYDLKNGLENLSSDNRDGLRFPALYFFQPKRLIVCRQGEITFEYLHFCCDEIQSDILDIENTLANDPVNTGIEISASLTKAQYLDRVRQMQSYIAKGDIYEANFCIDFFANGVHLSPVAVYGKLNSISTPPFSAFLKHASNFAMCASPERFIRKDSNVIISQPIKGTARRSNDAGEDAEIARMLSENQKERAENIMIVDLVRNDLSKTASKDSVIVTELCAVYSFRQVHHLISTITSKVDGSVPPVEVIKNAFPMGSMTGAPKISAMKIIEELEDSKRGIYSGSIGYFSPDGDFDFNVVIRSILYNSAVQYVSFSVGSAITSLSDPESEYEECLLKASAMRSVLNGATE